MNSFMQRLLNTKKVSVWGIGYLGYSSLLKLQDYGVKASVYDFSTERLNDLLNKKYPNNEQFNSWSKNGKVPSIDLDYISVCKDIDCMFDNVVHIISFPNTEENEYSVLADLFINNKNKLADSLVIFQSAGVPTKIEEDFCKLLKKEGIDIDVATVFRSDWIIEDFFQKNKTRVVSGNNVKASEKVKHFLSYIDIDAIDLYNIEEAEIYENTKNALNYTIVAFFNQMSLSYPHINMNDLSIKLLNQIDFSSLKLGVSSIDFKSEQSIENLLRATKGDFLTILKEANSTNIAYLFYYVDILKSKNIDSVTILGVSSYNSLKDVRMSPSVILAEYLYKNNIEVRVFDDRFQSEELQNLLPYCKFLDSKELAIKTDAVFIMNINNQLRFLNQTDIEKTGLFYSKFIFDNTGFFSKFKFSQDSVYHQFGDDELIKVVK